MTNDLDLNISNGSFHFDASDHDAFVSHLTRIPENDRNGSAAYSYKNWKFWLSPDKSVCRFELRLNRNETPSKQNGDGQPATDPELQ